MSSIRIDGFLIDDENEAEFAAHSIQPSQVVQILEHTYAVLRNRKKRRGIYLIIGRDNGGLCISVPVERTVYDSVWRPITAWPSKRGEETILEKNEG